MFANSLVAPGLSVLVTLRFGSGPATRYFARLARSLRRPARVRRGREAEAARENALAVVTMKQLLEAGVHFGHQARRGNPKMKRLICMERNVIHSIDLQQTHVRAEEADAYVRALASDDE